MRIVTWNINGVRTLPQYHPWNSLKTFDDILNHLEADIICFQEMKSSRQSLSKQVALPPSFDSFFSFPARKTGYSGVAVYTRRSGVIPLKAEEGLTGLIQPKPPLTQVERVSATGTYPVDVGLQLDDDELNLKDLDSEGRALILDFGLFILINLYCPNSGETTDRLKYKMDYHHLLSSRVNSMIKEGREVIVLGDLNACAAVMDHCEGQLMIERGWQEGLEGEQGFWGKDERRWIRDWLVDEEKQDGKGCMVDVVRKFWPDRKGMYTCWNTKISARDTNYGTRIDYILITPNLVPWIKNADIQPQVKGSDHCPVFVDFHDCITLADGSTRHLVDVLGQRTVNGAPEPDPPRIAAKFWEEHQQKLLSNFFGAANGKKANAGVSSTRNISRASNATPGGSMSLPTLLPSSTTTSAHPHEDLNPSTIPNPKSASTLQLTSSFSSITSSQTETLPSSSQSDLQFSAAVPVPETPTTSTSASYLNIKRKLVPESPKFHVNGSTKKHKLSTSQSQTATDKGGAGTRGQATIASFFAPPKPKAKAKAKSKLESTSTSISGPGSTSVTNAKAKAKAKPPDVSMDRSYEDVNVNMDEGVANTPTFAVDTVAPEGDEDADYRFALVLSQSSPTPPPSSSQSKQPEKRQAWSALLAPTPAPCCLVHREPAKEFTVNKPGPNKGKRFFICSRPVGPGYDRGRMERPREQVDPQWKCDFFKWSNEVRKEMNNKGVVAKNGG